ncbi:MAG TPA: hypothetical protein VG754_07900 [Verrucomicrobiae bacterium]|nr:hypothetical protein [Verrucomicrobiae bacterium]
MKTREKGHSGHSRPHSEPNNASAPGAEMFNQAVKGYEQALRTSARLQEDAARWWTNVFQQSGYTQDWQRQMNSVVSEAIPTAERNLEESLRLVDQSCKTGLNLLKRAVNAPRSNGTSDVQSQMQDIFQSSLNVFHSNLQAITESQARVMESWTEFMRKGIDSTASTAASAASSATAAAK